VKKIRKGNESTMMFTTIIEIIHPNAASSYGFVMMHCV
jgi:hypothetical protein